MSKEEINVEEIYNGLRKHRGALTEVAKTVGCTPQWIRLVLLKKQYTSLEVVRVATEVWKAKQEQQAMLTAQISSNISMAKSVYLNS